MGTLVDEQVMEGKTAMLPVLYPQGIYIVQVGAQYKKIVVQ
jgi:hypothetical protein